MNETTIQGWLVRDYNRSLWVFKTKPQKRSQFWSGDGLGKLGRNLFPQVKWEDPEPTEVELTIKIKEQ